MRVSGVGVKVALGVGDATEVGVASRGLGVKVESGVGVDWAIGIAFWHPAIRLVRIEKPMSSTTTIMWNRDR
jgi:hypothetical protein